MRLRVTERGERREGGREVEGFFISLGVSEGQNVRHWTSGGFSGISADGGNEITAAGKKCGGLTWRGVENA